MSWEHKLCIVASNPFSVDDIIECKHILSSEQVRINGNLRRNLWQEGKSPLHSAACKGNNTMINLLIKSGVNVNSHVVNDSGDRCTALHLAVLNNAEAVKLLLELGADLGVEGKWGEFYGRPMDFAKKRGCVDVVRMLEEAIAKQPKKRKESRSSLRQKSTDETHEILMQKLKSKYSLEAVLNDAICVQSKINDKIDRLNQIDLETQEMKEVFKAEKEKLERKFNAEMKKLEEVFEEETATKDALKKKLTNAISSLQLQPEYRELDEMESIMQELEQLELFTRSIQESSSSLDVKSCLVCMEGLEQVFSCQVCDNWVCGRCRERLDSCPSCRQDFRANPPVRNRGMERLLSRI